MSSSSGLGGPEKLDGPPPPFGEIMTEIRERVGPDLTRLAAEYSLPEEDMQAIAVVWLAQQLRMAANPGGLVLLVEGTVTPFNSGLEAMLASSPDRRHSQLLRHMLNESTDSEG